MSTVLVNGRVDARVKRQAESVLAAHHTTSSQAIRGLYQYLAETRRLPDFLMAADADQAHAERERKLAALLSVAGISAAPAIATDEGAAQVLAAEMQHRHG